MSGLTALKSGASKVPVNSGLAGAWDFPLLRDVGPVDRLRTAQHVVVAGVRVLDAGVLVERAAVDGHRRAVLARGAPEALELRDVPGAVELQLHVRVARMLADVVGRLGIGPDEVVGVGVRLADLGELGRRLACRTA